MRIALAVYGTRGDVEPSLAVGCELVRRGHDVQVAVPPDLVGLAESVGFVPVVYGPDSQIALAKNAGANFFGESTHRSWDMKHVIRVHCDNWEFSKRCREEFSKVLMSIAEGKDLLFHGQIYEDLADNVAEYYGIPMATLHYIPLRPNGLFLWFLPAPLSRAMMSVFWWLTSRLAGSAEKRQRRQLGLPKDSRAATRRITDRGSLEIQGYDEVCFPGLATEWAKWKEQRPIVGTLSLELPTAVDEEVESWIASGSAPICFAFGSMSLQSPADTIALISDVCGLLGERALVCAGSSGFTPSDSEHVKVVATMNYATIFPACRAVIHHGGAGTMAAALRAGVPHLVLWSAPDRRMRGAVIARLKVGISRRFSGDLNSMALAKDLRQILEPHYRDRAHAVSLQMKTPSESTAAAADYIEAFAAGHSSR